MLSFGIAVGCSKETSGSDAADEETGEECLPVDDDSPCICTDLDEFAWGCQCFYDPPGPAEYWGNPAICSEPDPGGIGYVCGTNYTNGYDACGDLCGDQLVEYAIDFRINPDQIPVPCIDNAASMSCGSWDPGNEIT